MGLPAAEATTGPFPTMVRTSGGCVRTRLSLMLKLPEPIVPTHVAPCVGLPGSPGGLTMLPAVSCALCESVR